MHHAIRAIPYAAQAYKDLLKKYGIQISMAAQAAGENGYAERLMRTIKKRRWIFPEYRDLDDTAQADWVVYRSSLYAKRNPLCVGY